MSLGSRGRTLELPPAHLDTPAHSVRWGSLHITLYVCVCVSVFGRDISRLKDKGRRAPWDLCNWRLHLFATVELHICPQPLKKEVKEVSDKVYLVLLPTR